MKGIKSSIIAYVLIPLLLISITEVSSYFLFKKYTPFYEAPDESEIALELYSTLDPNLGYSYNPHYSSGTPSRKRLGASRISGIEYSNQGFLISRHKEKSNPIRIAILGGSAADSNIFNGNWPWYFHKILVEADIPHIIYNGAVSGYSSHQELFKLIRDVFQIDKIDLVINYNGINDTIENGDVTKNHPSIHPYEGYLYDRLQGNISFFENSSFLPNFFHAIKLVLKKLKTRKFIQYGVAQKSVLDAFEKNLKYMNIISKENGAEFFSFLQAMNKESRNKENRSLEEAKNIERFFYKAESRLSQYPFFISFKELLSKQPNLFVDICHLNDKGNKLVASAIYQKLKVNLKK